MHQTASYLRHTLLDAASILPDKPQRTSRILFALIKESSPCA